ncbi:hypothetical protein TrST_g4134 [Triparma strigata]|uniref:Uncharacterized protein n=1 Tax=Triparma strigata TaxID=1606541 RepID=A0A9W6ZUP1_9STRA|nr:hypothetical protein TrST_g4134 [Triparma strigata]
MAINYFILYVLMAIDTILQVAVLFVVYDEDVEKDVQSLVEGGCWDSFYAYITVDGLENDIKFIRILGWFELVLGIGSAISARYEIGKIDRGKNQEDMKNKGIQILSLTALVLDTAISAIDFFIFTENTKINFDDLTRSVYSTSDVEDKFKSCVRFNTLYDPTPKQADDNCLELPLPEPEFPVYIIILLSLFGAYLLIKLLLWEGRREGGKFKFMRDSLVDLESKAEIPESPTGGKVITELVNRGTIWSGDSRKAVL